MKTQFVTAALLGFAFLATPALAASHGNHGGSCEAKATEKKLSGAAKTSFVAKCEKDGGAHAACEQSAVDKKLAGAAKTSHIKKCEADAAAAMKKP